VYCPNASSRGTYVHRGLRNGGGLSKDGSARRRSKVQTKQSSQSA
jgi:hypothetical protein